MLTAAPASRRSGRASVGKKAVFTSMEPALLVELDRQGGQQIEIIIEHKILEKILLPARKHERVVPRQHSGQPLRQLIGVYGRRECRLYISDRGDGLLGVGPIVNAADPVRTGHCLHG